MPFDIGLGELIGIAVVALIVLGPEKLPRYAADAARMLRTVRKLASDARAEVTKELGPELSSLGDLNPRSLVRKHLLEPVDLDDLDDLGEDNPMRRTKPTTAARRAAGERYRHRRSRRAPALRRGRHLAGRLVRVPPAVVVRARAAWEARVAGPPSVRLTGRRP